LIDIDAVSVLLIRCAVTPNTNESRTTDRTTRNSSQFWWSITIAVLVWATMVWFRDGEWLRFKPLIDPVWNETPTPLVMKGGDPYIRALMRTISASESNSPRPYSLLYGGEHIHDFSRHPDKCVTIVAGPNVGDCTTAAGRYQMLTTTWMRQAQLYHPNSPMFFFWQDYSFEPQYQDEVVYRWLSDPSAWGADLSQLLQAGQLDEVLYILSPTWTSLGYGIETNDMTGYLPGIYQEMLQEELRSGR
jgi:muramidase (phage lysozyme)